MRDCGKSRSLIRSDQGKDPMVGPRGVEGQGERTGKTNGGPRADMIEPRLECCIQPIKLPQDDLEVLTILMEAKRESQ